MDINIGLKISGIVELTDSSVIISCTRTFYSDTLERNITTYCLVKLDAGGDEIWRKDYLDRYDTDINTALNIAKDSDDNIILCGRGNGSEIFSSKFYKITQDGSVVWGKASGTLYTSLYYSGIAINEDTVLLYGWGGNETNFIGSQVIKINKLNGDEIASLGHKSTAGAPDFGATKAFLCTKDGGYALVGGSDIVFGSPGSTPVVKYDKDFNVIWSKNLKDAAGVNPSVNSILETEDGGFIVSGSSNGHLFIAKVAGDGSFCHSLDDFDASLSSFQRDGFDASENIQDVPSSSANFEQTESEGSGVESAVCSFVLPLQILSFTATSSGRMNLLQWKTGDNFNIDRFEVQRSSRGSSFEVIGNIAVSSATNNNSAYTFTDKQPVAATNYYRLKIYDRNGRYSYSSVVLTNNIKSWDVLLYPNQVDDKLILHFNSNQASDVVIRIVNTSGTLIYNSQLHINKGSDTKTITVSPVPAGNYLIQVSGGGDQQVLRFIRK